MRKSSAIKYAVFLTLVFLITGFWGCGNDDKSIILISREEGSGTRTAFTELTGIESKGIDRTYERAEITNSTSVVMQSVIGNINAIGYISLKALSDDVKALKIDDIKPEPENIETGKYKISRQLELITKNSISSIARDFIKYTESMQGHKLIKEEGYILQKYKNDDSRAYYRTGGLSGTLKIAGSTSAAPLVEALTYEYMKLNPNVKTEVQQTGSSAGIQSVSEGICDIGMSSRNLTEEERSRGLKSRTLALDGIIVIVNNKNNINGLTSEQLRDVFMGKITKWEDIESK